MQSQSVVYAPDKFDALLAHCRTKLTQFSTSIKSVKLRNEIGGLLKELHSIHKKLYSLTGRPEWECKHAYLEKIIASKGTWMVNDVEPRVGSQKSSNTFQEGKFSGM